MASKKGGLGAQKVSSKSFSDLEKKAQAADKLREKDDRPGAAKNNQPEQSMWAPLLSLMGFYLLLLLPLSFCHFLNSPPFRPPSSPFLRLACQDFEQQRKMEENKLKGLEGNKKVQAERLGMGLGMRRYDGGEAGGPVAEQPESCSHQGSIIMDDK